MKKKLFVYSGIFLLAIGGAIASNAKTNVKKFNVNAFRPACANQVSENCSTTNNSLGLCTHAYGGTIGTVQVYAQRSESVCDITLYKAN